MNWDCLLSGTGTVVLGFALTEHARAPLIYVVACEPSGDQIGALLMKALKTQTEGNLEFAGIGGPQMCAAGLNTLFDPKDLALLGIFEVLPKARLVFERVATTIADIEAKQPDILITIDSWGFTGRIHQRLARRGSAVPRVRYVAPQVWAWRPGRAKQLSRWIHHLLALLPFEPEYFTRHGLATTWVGHPVVESGFGRDDGAQFKKRHDIAPGQAVVGVLPGSRRGEVTRLLPVFSEAIKQLSLKHNGIHVVLPTIPGVSALVNAAARSWPIEGVTVVTGEAERREAFAAFDVALAASGTVSLELAAAQIPHVVAYKVNPLSALAFRYLAKTSRVNLVNIILDRDAVPERLQGQCYPELLANDLSFLLKDERTRSAQRADFAAALARLTPPGSQPSQKAASVILSLMAGQKS